MAQLLELADKEDFSENAIALTFQELRNTSPAGDAYTSYRVKFVSESGGPLTLSNVPLHGGFLPPFALVLRNEPPTGMAGEDALILQLEDPLQRLGLQLDSIAGAPGTTATVQAFTVKGELLGAIEHPVPARPEILFDAFNGTFLGMETSHPLGISTVVIDYGPEQPIEQVNEILIDPITPRVFRTYVPHIVQAAVGDLLFQTSIEVVGSRNVQEATVRFFDPLGEFLSISFDGEESFERQFVFPFGNVFELTPDPPSGDLKVGYAIVESMHPIQAQATYQISGPSGTQWEVTATAAAGRVIHRAPVRKEMAKGLDTAIAVINIGDALTSVPLELHTPEGTPEEIRTRPFFILPPGEMRAFFLSEVCEQTPPESTTTFCSPQDFLRTQDFEGSLRIITSQPTVVLVLRTLDGLPVSLVPVGGGTQR